MKRHIVHASLFSGIGGPEVAAAMLGWENAFHCEINPFGRRVLEYWFPDSVSYEDITQTDFTPWRGKVDVLTGGFPCQPFSYAGNRGGQKDARYLWPEMCRAIQEIRPTWVVGENVAGITTMVEGGVLSEMGAQATLFQEGDIVHGYELEQSFTVERICSDLERIGYSVQPMLIPAAAVGAPHRRDRIFIIAYAPDSDNSAALRGSEKHEGESQKEWLPKWDDVQFARKSSNVRQETCDASANSGDARSEIERGRQAEIHSPGSTSHSNGKGRRQVDQHIQPELADGAEPLGSCGLRPTADTFRERLSAALQSRCYGAQEWYDAGRPVEYAADDTWAQGTWWNHFPTVSPVHTRNDGLSQIMDGNPLGFHKWRNESIKAYGNAIVPQVMYRIFQAIDELKELKTNQL